MSHTKIKFRSKLDPHITEASFVESRDCYACGASKGNVGGICGQTKNGKHIYK